MIEDFMKACCKTEGLVFSTGNRYAILESEVKTAIHPICENGAMHIAGENWAVHVNLKEIQHIQFNKIKEPTGIVPYLFNALLLDQTAGSVLTIFFPNPWLDENLRPCEIQKNRLELFKAIKDKYTTMDSTLFSYNEVE